MILGPTLHAADQTHDYCIVVSVVYHHGKTSTGGHYTTSMFHPGINGWVHSDDSTVKTVLVRDVLRYVPQRVPYLLYYRRLDSH